MSKRISVTTLNASTIDILNTIRANASYEYQSTIPVVEQAHDIPAVGELLYGYPALANQFINALVNRIALVRVKSAVFNNAYSNLKKGYLEFGETVEEVFVGICKAREFSAEKAESREMKRSLPDVRSAFHAMNWRVQYPITIQDEDLRMAFTSINGVQDLIAKIVDSVYTAAEYDEYLLFKYLLIKAVAKGKMYPVSFDSTDMKNAAIAFRGVSNQLTFMNTKFNASGVHTSTPKTEQYIFMDSDFNAKYDVDVLSAAFNMDKADFAGKLKLIDSFDSFDNDRFSIISDNSDMIEPVTDAELAIMQNVKAILLDGEWFQIYDNNNKFTERYVSSGMYWNYFYNVWKTVSSSPFSNAVVFVDSEEETVSTNLTVKVTDVSADENARVIAFDVEKDETQVGNVRFVQTAEMTAAGVAVQRYGAVILPESAQESGYAYDLTVNVGENTFTLADAISASVAIGDTLTLVKQ